MLKCQLSLNNRSTICVTIPNKCGLTAIELMYTFDDDGIGLMVNARRNQSAGTKDDGQNGDDCLTHFHE